LLLFLVLLFYYLFFYIEPELVNTRSTKK